MIYWRKSACQQVIEWLVILFVSIEASTIDFREELIDTIIR